MRSDNFGPAVVCCQLVKQRVLLGFVKKCVRDCTRADMTRGERIVPTVLRESARHHACSMLPRVGRLVSTNGRSKSRSFDFRRKSRRRTHQRILTMVPA